MLTFMWAVGIDQTSPILFAALVEAGGYGFSARSVGFLFFTAVVAVCLGETFGQFFNDYLSARYIRTHRGHFKPEARLVSNYIAAFLVVPSIVLVGQSLAKHLNYGAIVMGWGMFVFGCMVATVTDGLRVGVVSYRLRRSVWIYQSRSHYWRFLY
jgi:hypothetical protein